MSYVLILLILGVLIGLHEFGHFLAAKACRIPVARFSIGFGPKLWGFERKETSYRLCLLPLGGYVLPGLEPEEFEKLPIRQRVLFALGGPVANLAGAWVALTLFELRAGVGLVQGMSSAGTRLLELAGRILSVVPSLFTAPDTLSGVVGIVSVGGSQFASTAAGLAAFWILLNVNLAVFNLLPIPPLDGARILFCALERVWPRSVRWQRPATVLGWGFLLAVMLYATFQDVVRLAGVVA